MPSHSPSPKRKKRRAALSSLRIAGAAFDIIDSQGVSALSARHLAASLKCEAMSIYHHVANMESILDLVVDQLMMKLELPEARPGESRRQLLETSQAFLQLALDHPNVFVLAVSRRWVTPGAFRLVQASIRMFEAAGASTHSALRSARILGAYLSGAGTALTGWAKRNDTLDPERAKQLEAVAPGLPSESTLANVRRDIDRGLSIVVDALLADALD